MIKLKTTDDNVIVKIIPTEEKIGSIILTSTSKAKSTLAEIMIPASESYYRNGELRPQSRYVAGTKVRITSGNCGTKVLEAPDGEEWLCLPEDAIYYSVEEM